MELTKKWLVETLDAFENTRNAIVASRVCQTDDDFVKQIAKTIPPEKLAEIVFAMDYVFMNMRLKKLDSEAAMNKIMYG